MSTLTQCQLLSDFVSLLDVDHRHNVACVTIHKIRRGPPEPPTVDYSYFSHHQSHVPSTLSSLFSFSFGTRSRVMVFALFPFVPNYYLVTISACFVSIGH
ncbi:hypothetical protein BDR06DRAFT_1015561 [Suillus hirtellus]|nr:hypothetical protein BDR06DRAFT_1015561 [Suillus hirtellus]